jgi:hypothetical protein
MTPKIRGDTPQLFPRGQLFYLLTNLTLGDSSQFVTALSYPEANLLFHGKSLGHRTGKFRLEREGVSFQRH